MLQDPSQVVWQNIEITKRGRCCRGTGVAIVTALLLCVSIVFLVLIAALQVKYKSALPGSTVCDSVLPAVAFGETVDSLGHLPSGVTLPAGLTLVKNASEPFCASYGMVQLRWTATNTSIQPLTSVTAQDSCLNECYAPKNSPGTCTVEAVLVPGTGSGAANSGTTTNLTYVRSEVVACYCLQQLDEALSSVNSVFTATRALLSNEEQFCLDTALDFLRYQAIRVAAASVVAIINLALALCIRLLTNSEGHEDLDSLQRSTALKAFLAQFINTALLSFVIDAAMPIISTVLGVTVPIYASNGPLWHYTVGASLCLTMIINAFAQHARTLLLLLLVHPCLRCGGTRGALHQDELNVKLAPPEFLIANRTADVLLTFATCFMYSAGNPVILVIGAGSVLVSYYVDQLSLLRVYRRPPRFNAGSAKFIASVLPFAIVAHLVIAIWQYSDPLVLQSQSALGDSSEEVLRSGVSTLSTEMGGFSLVNDATSSTMKRMLKESTFPLTVILIAFVSVWFLLSTAGRAALAFAEEVLQLCCGRCSVRRCCGCCAKGPTLYERQRPRLRNSPFTGPFAAPLNATQHHELNAWEWSAGARLYTDPFGQLVKAWVWPYRDNEGPALTVRDAIATEDGAAVKGHGANAPVSADAALRMASTVRAATDALPLSARADKQYGQRLRTWEVVSLTGLASFHIEDNPLYSPALMAVHAARALLPSADGAPAGATPATDTATVAAAGASAGHPAGPSAEERVARIVDMDDPSSPGAALHGASASGSLAVGTDAALGGARAVSPATDVRMVTVRPKARDPAAAAGARPSEEDGAAGGSSSPRAGAEAAAGGGTARLARSGAGTRGSMQDVAAAMTVFKRAGKHRQWRGRTALAGISLPAQMRQHSGLASPLGDAEAAEAAGNETLENGSASARGTRGGSSSARGSARGPASASVRMPPSHAAAYTDAQLASMGFPSQLNVVAISEEDEEDGGEDSDSGAEARAGAPGLRAIANSRAVAGLLTAMSRRDLSTRHLFTPTGASTAAGADGRSGPTLAVSQASAAARGPGVFQLRPGRVMPAPQTVAEAVEPLQGAPTAASPACSAAGGRGGEVADDMPAAVEEERPAVGIGSRSGASGAARLPIASPVSTTGPGHRLAPSTAPESIAVNPLV
jgi:hypothetical protein